MRDFGQKIERDLDEMMKVTRESAEIYDVEEPDLAYKERKEKAQRTISACKKKNKVHQLHLELE